MLENQNHLKNLIVITGGARSGKSKFAEQLAHESNLDVAYVATMPRVADDEELCYKIEKHRQQRPQSWTTYEAERSIHQTLTKLPKGPGVCIIDCLSLYVSNMMLSAVPLNGASEHTFENPVSPRVLSRLDREIDESIEEMIDSIRNRQDLTFIVVTNEVGWSVVPDNKAARIYKDLLGEANQKMAQVADTVYLACSGLKVKLKEAGNSRLQ
jgi:Adenosyl cobinamide kinase/adenosyl cobinamide phosphate guanylyltransferase